MERVHQRGRGRGDAHQRGVRGREREPMHQRAADQEMGQRRFTGPSGRLSASTMTTAATAAIAEADRHECVGRDVGKPDLGRRIGRRPEDCEDEGKDGWEHAGLSGWSLSL